MKNATIQALWLELNLRSSMPVYLVFLQVAKKNLQLALRGPNLPASLEACKLRQGTRH